MTTIFDKLQSAVATTLRVPASTIHESTRAEDIQAWDSLGHINLMMTLGQTFGILLDIEDFSRLNSVPAMIEFLREQGIE
jgi:acyl carrier protein